MMKNKRRPSRLGTIRFELKCKIFPQIKIFCTKKSTVMYRHSQHSPYKVKRLAFSMINNSKVPLKSNQNVPVYHQFLKILSFGSKIRISIFLPKCWYTSYNVDFWFGSRIHTCTCTCNFYCLQLQDSSTSLYLQINHFNCRKSADNVTPCINKPAVRARLGDLIFGD